MDIKLCSWLWVHLYLPFFLHQLPSLAISQPHHYYVAPSISWTNKPSETYISFDSKSGSKVKGILLRESDGPIYACGFFCDGNCDAYLLAIFILDGLSIYGEMLYPDFDDAEPEIVWSANRNNPVKINAILELTSSGLILKDFDGTTIWSTETSGKSVASLNLTDNGNLILFDKNDGIVWQSFDHPTDTLLYGQKLMAGKNLTANVSPSNRSSGLFSLSVTNEGLFVSIESNPPQIYYQFIYNGTKESKEPSYVKYFNGTLGFYVPSCNTSEPEKMIPIQQHIDLLVTLSFSFQIYFRLEFDGSIRVYNDGLSFNAPSYAPNLLWNLISYCDYPLACGKYGVCMDKQCSCQADFNGTNSFKQINYTTKPYFGCPEITPSCEASQYHSLEELEDITYFTFRPDVKDVDVQTCKQACLYNCS